MDKARVDQLLKRVLEDILPNGKVDEADEVYAQDVVPHFRNEDFLGLDDIKNRIRAIRDHTKNRDFKIKDVLYISDELVTFLAKQSWRSKLDNSYHSVLVSGTYRIKNYKISEIFLLFDANVSSYREINQDFNKVLHAVEHNYKTRKDFICKLKQSNMLCKKLSEMELESLYFYLHGFSSKEAALELGISHRTVESYLVIVKDKFCCRSKAELRKKIFPNSKAIKH